MAAAKESEFLRLLQAAITAAGNAEQGGAADAEGSRAVDALRVLQRQNVTAELLAKTDAGKKVKKLCKHASKAICSAALAVVEAWKECVRVEQKGKQRADDVGKQEQQAGPQRSSQQGLDSQGSLGTAPSLEAPVKLSTRPPRSGDPTRDKIRDLLAEALASASSADVPGDPCEVAVEVEDAMFKQNGGVSQKYKSKYRTLAFNLKDPANPDLRSKVLMGHIPADILVNLSAEELASDDRRNDNDKIRDLKKKECQRGQSTMASTDMFQCAKCKQRKCTYYQMQTRSADEPMTTFVTCTVCSNRWKFC